MRVGLWCGAESVIAPASTCSVPLIQSFGVFTGPLILQVLAFRSGKGLSLRMLPSVQNNSMCAATAAKKPAKARCSLRLSMRWDRRAPQLANKMLTKLMPKKAGRCT